MPYTVDILIQGFPGKSVCHGGLGWSTIALVRGEGRVMLVDCGAFNARKNLEKQLKARELAATDVTDIVLTHVHYDHSLNFTLFPNARIWVGATELDWARAQPPGFNPLPELYVQALARSPRMKRIKAGEEFIPGLRAIAAPGHTPGSLVFLLTDCEQPVLFTGDAAKNRAELLSGHVDASEDFEQSEQSIKVIWATWKETPGTLLVPGHDLTMRLDDEGRPEYLGEIEAGIAGWFGETLEKVTTVDICKRHVSRLVVKAGD